MAFHTTEFLLLLLLGVFGALAAPVGVNNNSQASRFSGHASLQPRLSNDKFGYVTANVKLSSSQLDSGRITTPATSILFSNPAQEGDAPETDVIRLKIDSNTLSYARTDPACKSVFAASHIQTTPTIPSDKVVLVVLRRIENDLWTIKCQPNPPITDDKQASTDGHQIEGGDSGDTTEKGLGGLVGELQKKNMVEIKDFDIEIS